MLVTLVAVMAGLPLVIQLCVVMPGEVEVIRLVRPGEALVSELGDRGWGVI